MLLLDRALLGLIGMAIKDNQFKQVNQIFEAFLSLHKCPKKVIIFKNRVISGNSLTKPHNRFVLTGLIKALSNY